MNRATIGGVIALLIMSNTIMGTLLLGRWPPAREGADAALLDSVSRLEGAIARLAEKVEVISAPRSEGAPAGPDTGPGPAAARVDPGILERLDGIEKLLTRMQSDGDELAVARLREERQMRFRGEDGHVAADELLAEKQFALAGSGYLEFLEHHPDHPDARAILQKARDAFGKGGYTEKAFGVHEEMMKKFPERRDEDLMALAQMEKDARKLDEAIQHAGEAAELATNEEDRVWRLMYRAWFIQLRDGDEAGLLAYRDVEKLAGDLGMGEKNPGKKVRGKIEEIEQRILGRR